ncbi:MAG TPA: gamma-glutamyltransferase [Candidatus Paceibacterota bacterium]|nr:gamma-glutamyltransferase [Candidatus Paceibacterota bacterium]
MCVSRAASDAGIAVLKRGGNAVDAAVAMGFALGVTYPAAGNIGGGGFILVHPPPGQGDPVAFNFRERAPSAAWPTMYSKEETQFAARAVAVPGTVRGLALAHKRFGKLPWPELVEPAVALSRDGFPLDKFLVDLLNEVLAAAPEKAEFQRVFGKPGGGLWQPGDSLKQPDLARTLQLIADSGPDAFYQGPIADQIAAEMASGDGLIKASDLADYQAVECKPLTTRYRGYDVFVPPPPSSGGVVLLEELNTLENFDLKKWGRWSPETFHVMAEAMRRANYDRARYIGDPAFVQIPEKLTTREYGRQLANSIDLNQATPSVDLSADIPLSPEGQDTTHFSVIDRDGMAAANTYSLERIWGSRVVVKNTGVLLNNMMRAFNLFPGVTDKKGNFGTAPNIIASGKRPISSMTPTIVARDGRVVLVTGSPGSQAIPSTVLCILTSVLDFGLPLPTAVESPRFSHKWFPDRITFEAPERYPELVNALKAIGHTVERTGPLPQGDAHSIWVSKPGDYLGVTDHRRNSQSSASGY